MVHATDRKKYVQFGDLNLLLVFCKNEKEKNGKTRQENCNVEITQSHFLRLNSCESKSFFAP
jgi:hypothetical protein